MSILHDVKPMINVLDKYNSWNSEKQHIWKPQGRGCGWKNHSRGRG